MRCGQCQTDNRAARRFCGSCGAPLPGACDRCGFVNEGDERFCGGCGVSVAAGAGPRSADRRQLTVLFCDLVGSTALSARLEADDLRDAINTFQRRCTEVIENHGGYVARYMGDGLLAYFGYLHADEDDAERAVRAGLDIVSTLGGAPLAPGLPPARTRVGLATGEVIVGDLLGAGSAEEKTVVGETPNLAARLQGLAEPDTVVVSAATRRLVNPLFDFEDRGRHAAKGFDDPVEVWRAVAPRRIGNRFVARRSHALTPLVGRDTEMTLLRERWDLAQAGEGQVVHLTGEAGMGKSRLVLELGRALAGVPHRLLSLQGATHQSSTPLRAVEIMLEEALGFSRDDSEESRLARLTTLAEDAGLSRGDVALLSPLFGLAPTDGPIPAAAEGQARARLASLVRAILGREDAAAPVLVLVEDAQWLDPTTRSVVAALASAVPGRRVLLLVTFRPGFDPGWSPSAGIALGRLGPEACLAMTRSAATSTVPADRIAEAAARADGVPLFVEELARGLEVSGAGGVPTSLKAALTARLDRAGAARPIAQLAAAVGTSVSLELLRAAWDGESDALDSGLDVLIAEGILEVGGSDSVRFRQTLLRDLAAESQLRRDREHAHGRLADALLARGEVDTPSLATHLGAAGRKTEAARTWLSVGARSISTWAREEAYRAYLEGLTLAPEVTDAETARLEAELRIGLGFVQRLRDQRHEGLAQIRPALALLETWGLDDLRPRYHVTEGNILFHVSDEEGEVAHRAGVEWSQRLGDRSHEARAYSGLGDVAYVRGEFATAETHYRRCIEAAEAAGCEDIVVANLGMVAWSRVYAWDFEEGLAFARRGIEAGAAAGDPKAESICRAVALVAIAELGLTVDLEAEARAIDDCLEGFDSIFFTASGGYLLAYNAWRQGDDALARARLDEVDRRFQAAGQAPFRICHTSLSLAFQSPEEGRPIAEELVRGLDGTFSAHEVLWSYIALPELLLERGWYDLAATLTDFVEDFNRAEPCRLARAITIRTRAHLAAAGHGERDPEGDALAGWVAEAGVPAERWILPT